MLAAVVFVLIPYWSDLSDSELGFTSVTLIRLIDLLQDAGRVRSLKGQPSMYSLVGLLQAKQIMHQLLLACYSPPPAPPRPACSLDS